MYSSVYVCVYVYMYVLVPTFICLCNTIRKPQPLGWPTPNPIYFEIALDGVTWLYVRSKSMYAYMYALNICMRGYVNMYARMFVCMYICL